MARKFSRKPKNKARRENRTIQTVRYHKLPRLISGNYLIYRLTRKCTLMFMMRNLNIVLKLINYNNYVIITKIILIIKFVVFFNRYGVATLLITSYFCILVIILPWRWPQHQPNMLVRKLWIKYIINIQVHFVGYLYIMDLLNERKWNVINCRYCL
jgi:hypothetical protein